MWDCSLYTFIFNNIRKKTVFEVIYRSSWIIRYKKMDKISTMLNIFRLNLKIRILSYINFMPHIFGLKWLSFGLNYYVYKHISLFIILNIYCLKYLKHYFQKLFVFSLEMFFLEMFFLCLLHPVIFYFAEILTLNYLIFTWLF